MNFIVTYRTLDGDRIRTEVEGVSAREVRALFSLKRNLTPGTLAVQPVLHRAHSGIVYANLGVVP